MLIVVNIYFVFLHIIYTYSQVCQGPNGPICCIGYVWNETHRNCTRCMDGFKGKDCIERCPAPSFGVDCQSICNCNNDNCHHVYGCKRLLSECEIGRTGWYCGILCPYPNYGKGCQLKCNCKMDLCDPAEGCTNLTSIPESTKLTIIKSSKKPTPAFPISKSTSTYIYHLVTGLSITASSNNGLKNRFCKTVHGGANALLYHVTVSLIVLAAVFLISYLGLTIHQCMFRTPLLHTSPYSEEI